MKNIKRVCILLFIIILFGCNNKTNEELTKSVVFDDMGVVSSDFGSKALLIHAKNNNDVNVNIDSEIKYIKDDINGSEVAFASLYPGGEAYYLIDLINDITPDSYELVNTVGSFKLSNYKKLCDNITFTENDITDTVITYDAKNNNNEEVNIYGIVLFYKDNKIIGASEGDCVASNNSSCKMEIFIPVDNVESYKGLKYDKKEIILSKISVGVD